MKKTMKMFSMLLAVLLLLTSVAACGGGGGEGGRAAETAGAPINDAILANYAYVPTFIDLPAMGESVQGAVRGAVAHGDRIFYYYIEQEFAEPGTDLENDPPSIVITSVLTDGSDPQRTEIPLEGGEFADVQGMTVTPAGNLALIATASTWSERGSETTTFYLELDQAGKEIARETLNLGGDGQWFQIDRVLFTDDGRMIIIAWTDRGSAVYLLDENRSVLGELDIEWTQGGVQTRDGRVFLADHEMDGDTHREVLREVDFETVSFGETYPISMTNMRSMFSAREGSEFDFYLHDGSYLYGYDLESGERTPLFGWIEAGIALDGSYHLSFLADGRISVLHSRWGRTRNSESVTELVVLTRTPRSELPEREIITLGGFSIFGDIRTQVVAFNRVSQTHQIQVKDYIIYNTNEDHNAGMVRFMAEVASGHGPDIVWGSPSNLATMADRGLFVDLNPYLDADPELSRTDFFGNILDAMQTADGTLPVIANSFSIHTMIGRTDAVRDITSWTFTDMLELVDQMDGNDPSRLLGQWMTGERFISQALITSGAEFIDWAEGRVNLDNDAFIHVLEIAARLPQDIEEEMDWENYVSHYALMQRGEQLLSAAYISQPTDIQIYMAVLDDIRALGVPTENGGEHMITPRNGLGINVTSEHQDIAWDFIRQTLLPEADADWTFPLRIDRFEDMMTEAMTPQLWTNEDGVEEEVSNMGVGFSDGLMINLYALTAEEAAIVRSIVESASLLGRFDDTVTEMIQEETLPFFAGDRSAADTARILQNRIQTYLSERR